MDFAELFIYGGVIAACVALPLIAVWFTWRGLEERDE